MSGTTNFSERLNEFLVACQGIIDKEYSDSPISPALEISSIGKKNAKIIISHYPDEATDRDKQISVWAFVDVATGNVLKPASFRAPAKGARGNIYNDGHDVSKMTAYGPQYLR